MTNALVNANWKSTPRLSHNAMDDLRGIGLANQLRKYQPKRLTARHEAILRAVHTGAKIQEVVKRFGISASQVGRITNSNLGRAYLRELRERATQITVETWASLMVYDMVAAKKSHLLNVR